MRNSEGGAGKKNDADRVRTTEIGAVIHPQSASRLWPAKRGSRKKICKCSERDKRARLYHVAEHVLVLISGPVSAV
jgi:hypothetical protein